MHVGGQVNGKNEVRRGQREHRGSDRQLDRRDIDRHDKIGGKRERNRNDKENEMTRRNEMRGEMR